MIFDDEGFSAPAAQPGPAERRPAIETSIDDYWQERRRKLEKRDLSELYISCKLAINENYFKINSRNAVKVDDRRRKIAKGSCAAIADTPAAAQNALQVKSLNVVPFRLESRLSKPSIRELEAQDSQREMPEARPPRKENKQPRSLGHFCSMHNIDSHRASALDANFESHKARVAQNAKEQWDRENYSTLKSLESLDGTQPQKKEKENVITFDDKCPVCRKRFGLRAGIAITVRCDHIFHESCFRKWVEKNCKALEEQCPKCLSQL